MCAQAAALPSPLSLPDLPGQILVSAGRQAVLDPCSAAAPVDPMVDLLWRESSGVLTLLSTIRTIHEAPSAASDRLAAH